MMKVISFRFLYYNKSKMENKKKGGKKKNLKDENVNEIFFSFLPSLSISLIDLLFTLMR